MEFDLDEPIFKQSDVLKLVPGLTQGTLQNWVARDIFEVANRRPHKHAKLHWSPISVIAMRFMMQVGKLGIKPSVAIELADIMVQQVDDFMERFKPVLIEETGVLEYQIAGVKLDEYQRMEIMADDNGKLFIVSMSNDAKARNLIKVFLRQSIAAVTVETDLLFIFSLNAISRHLAGVDPSTGRK